MGPDCLQRENKVYFPSSYQELHPDSNKKIQTQVDPLTKGRQDPIPTQNSIDLSAIFITLFQT
jgi:hypothetical protein